jgi:hypothetical protein
VRFSARTGAREHPRRVAGQAEVGRIAHVGLDHGGVDPGGAGDEPAPPAGGPADQLAADLLDHLGAEATHQLSDRGLVRNPLSQGDAAEAAQVQRV